MMMDDRLSALRELATHPGTRKQRAQLAVPLVRSLGSYRWTGLYDVTAEEISVIAWDGPEPPTYPRFPVSKGLNGAAVAARRAVIVQDVTADPRYLTTIAGTGGEMIQPIIGASGTVIGTIDVEAGRINAFAARDEALLSACAAALRWLWP